MAMITIIRFLQRPSFHISAHISHSFNRGRAFSACHPLLRSRERLKKSRFGILSNVRSSMSSSASPVLSAQQVDGEILKAINDEHGGVIVEMTNGPLDAAAYVSLLRASLSHWRQQGKRGIWIKLPIELANLVEPTVKEGFYFHHAEPDYLMLVSWLPSTANTLPANASHRVGIGAFVLNEKNEVLVVQEKSGRFRGSGVWKFPTGVVDEGEDICDAAVREVKEETWIDSKFLEVLAFRIRGSCVEVIFNMLNIFSVESPTISMNETINEQSHKSYFEKSDLFFLCMMQPLSWEIQPQEAEIEAAQWMPYEEYVAQPFVQKHDLLRKIAEVCESKRNGTYSGFQLLPTSTGFSQTNLYVNRRSLGQNLL